MKKAAIIMGSDSDLKVMSAAAGVLEDYGIPYEVHIYSAHRTPEETAAFAAAAKDNGFGVIIAGAGMSAALAGVLAAHTVLPVIGVPLKSSVFDGMDALLSTVMMPPGIPVASVAVNGAKNAAHLAAQILAGGDEALAEKIASVKKAQKEAVLQKDASVMEKMKEYR